MLGEMSETAGRQKRWQVSYPFERKKVQRVIINQLPDDLVRAFLAGYERKDPDPTWSAQVKEAYSDAVRLYGAMYNVQTADHVDYAHDKGYYEQLAAELNTKYVDDMILPVGEGLGLRGYADSHELK